MGDRTAELVAFYIDFSKMSAVAEPPWRQASAQMVGPEVEQNQVRVRRTVEEVRGKRARELVLLEGNISEGCRGIGEEALGNDAAQLVAVEAYVGKAAAPLKEIVWQAAAQLVVIHVHHSQVATAVEEASGKSSVELVVVEVQE
eukprot:3304047-Rhodomonas_salina.1